MLKYRGWEASPVWGALLKKQIESFVESQGLETFTDSSKGEAPSIRTKSWRGEGVSIPKSSVDAEVAKICPPNNNSAKKTDKGVTKYFYYYFKGGIKIFIFC